MSFTPLQSVEFMVIAVNQAQRLARLPEFSIFCLPIIQAMPVPSPGEKKGVD
jgi:hypothetical protein